jgi:excisionase family DNA binding protein
MSETRELAEKIQHVDALLVACVVFQTQAPEHLIQKIREAITAMAVPSSVCPVVPESTSPRAVPQDAWLRHAEAADHLGISKSTLYQYVCQRKIECRKLGGRLEYRRSSLDRFKDLKIRHPREWFPQESIILPALHSGK